MLSQSQFLFYFRIIFLLIVNTNTQIVNLTHKPTHGLSLRLVLQNGECCRSELMRGQHSWVACASGNKGMLCLDWTSMSDCDRARWVSGSACGLIGHWLKWHKIGLLVLWCHLGSANAVSLNTSICKIHMQPMFPLSHSLSCAADADFTDA